MIRVGLIKQDTKQLIQFLKSLWPHLLSELVSIFEVNKETYNEIEKYYTNQLTIEAIKLIELLSSLNLEDFQMNQWIFLVDKVGMKKVEMDNYQSSMRDTVRLQNKSQSAKADEGETFKTFIVKYVDPDQQFTFNNVENPQDGIDADKILSQWKTNKK